MYFNCRDVVGGCKVFAEAKDAGCDCITYNATITGFVRENMHEEALSVLTEMMAAGVSPDELTFVTIMSACDCAKVGRKLQAKAMKSGFEAYTSVSNATITMYSSVGELRAAELIFERLEERDLISWNVMISSYTEGSFERSAFLTFLQMQGAGIASDKFTVGSLLMITEFLETVAMIHAFVFKNGLLMQTEVSNALISSYSKHERVDIAHQVFCEMLYQNLISWNAVISGFLFNGNPLVSLALFSELLAAKLSSDVCTITHIVNSCACISALNYGRQVHNFIIRFGFMSETCLGNALISLYAKCGNLDWSIRVFNVMIHKDVVSWNSLISAFAQHGEGKEAVMCFKAMQDPINVIRPDSATFTALLSACSHAGLVEDALKILDAMVTSYGVIPETDHLSCIVDLLGRAGFLDEAEKVGSVQAHPNIWWALFSACVAHGDLRLGRIVAEYLLEADKNDSSVYIQVSNIYAGAGQWDEATNIREFMRNNGVSKQLGWSSVSI
uniref:Pentatricopeptide repeat-containing protein n=1 Tax=Kalanchoe fedtschenkoi TaxID=63787 RepID=A0A7N0UW38_KALFE